jgi:hypothetical protein
MYTIIVIFVFVSIFTYSEDFNAALDGNKTSMGTFYTPVIFALIHSLLRTNQENDYVVFYR